MSCLTALLFSRTWSLCFLLSNYALAESVYPAGAGAFTACICGICTSMLALNYLLPLHRDYWQSTACYGEVNCHLTLRLVDLTCSREMKIGVWLS